MPADCGCTCTHTHSYVPMTAQDLAVTQLMLFAFLLMLPALVGIHFWVQAKRFPGKMLVPIHSPAQSVFMFRRHGLSRIGAALTLPFLFSIFAIIVRSHPSFHNLDSTLLWLLFAHPVGMYSSYGLYAALKHLGWDELQIDFAQGTFRRRMGLLGLEKTSTGKISSLGQLENEISPAASCGVSERLRRQAAAKKLPLRRPRELDKQGDTASCGELTSRSD